MKSSSSNPFNAAPNLRRLSNLTDGFDFGHRGSVPNGRMSAQVLVTNDRALRLCGELRRDFRSFRLPALTLLLRGAAQNDGQPVDIDLSMTDVSLSTSQRHGSPSPRAARRKRRRARFVKGIVTGGLSVYWAGLAAY